MDESILIDFEFLRWIGDADTDISRHVHIAGDGEHVDWRGGADADFLGVS